MRRCVSSLLMAPGFPAAPDAWFDGQDPTNGFQGNITSWKDKSGKGNNAAVVGTLIKTTVGGFTWATGFSSSNYFSVSGLVYQLTKGVECFAVIQRTASSGGRGSAVSASSFTSDDFLLEINGSENTETLVDSSADTFVATGAAVPLNTSVLISGGYNPQTKLQSAQQTGTARTATTVVQTTQGPTTGFLLGSTAVDTSDTLPGILAEVLIYCRPISASVSGIIRAYLNQKYGLSP